MLKKQTTLNLQGLTSNLCLVYVVVHCECAGSLLITISGGPRLMEAYLNWDIQSLYSREGNVASHTLALRAILGGDTCLPITFQ